MKANEIRIGNWVMGNAPYQLSISELNTHINYLRMGREGYFTPIPLTEEWLDKFSFREIEHKGVKGFLSGNCEFLYQPEDKMMYSFSEVDGSVWSLRRIWHVHQLQNLWFAINGTELEIK